MSAALCCASCAVLAQPCPPHPSTALTDAQLPACPARPRCRGHCCSPWPTACRVEAPAGGAAGGACPPVEAAAAAKAAGNEATAAAEAAAATAAAGAAGTRGGARGRRRWVSVQRSAAEPFAASQEPAAGVDGVSEAAACKPACRAPFARWPALTRFIRDSCRPTPNLPPRLASPHPALQR